MLGTIFKCKDVHHTISVYIKCQDVQHSKGKRMERREGKRGKGEEIGKDLARGDWDRFGEEKTSEDRWKANGGGMTSRETTCFLLNQAGSEFTESNCVTHQGVNPLIDNGEHIHLHSALHRRKKGEGTVKKTH